MKYWKLDCDVNHYANLMCEGENNYDFFHSFNGEHKLKTWRSPVFKRMDNMEFSNTPGLSSHIPVFDEKAVGVLREYLKDGAEVLPITCSDGKFYIINVTNVQDCIDYEKSRYRMFRDGKRIMLFSEYVFDINKTKDCGDIFKLKDEPLRRPFVSDQFRRAVIENNLVGFEFELAWDSEADM